MNSSASGGRHIQADDSDQRFLHRSLQKIRQHVLKHLRIVSSLYPTPGRRPGESFSSGASPVNLHLERGYTSGALSVSHLSMTFPHCPAKLVPAWEVPFDGKGGALVCFVRVLSGRISGRSRRRHASVRPSRKETTCLAQAVYSLKTPRLAFQDGRLWHPPRPSRRRTGPSSGNTLPRTQMNCKCLFQVKKASIGTPCLESVSKTDSERSVVEGVVIVP
jgi:hypothetical protein